VHIDNNLPTIVPEPGLPPKPHRSIVRGGTTINARVGAAGHALVHVDRSARKTKASATTKKASAWPDSEERPFFPQRLEIILKFLPPFRSIQSGSIYRPGIYFWALLQGEPVAKTVSLTSHLKRVAFSVLYAALGFSCIFIAGVPLRLNLSVIISPRM